MAEQDVENELFACEADEEPAAVTETSTAPAKKKVKGSHDSIHSSGFRDFLLKPELLRAIVDCGLEHPSEVQQECIPKAILGMDVLCQAKSRMGKTAVFVLSTLQQIEPVDGQVVVLVLCPSRILADQISKEYKLFSKYMNTVKMAVFMGGLSIKKDRDVLKKNCPHIVVGTPGRTVLLVKEKYLNLKNVKHFVLEDCEIMLKQLDMRRDVLEIFRFTPREKQCMMFSATLSKDIQRVCRQFMHYDEARHFLLLETAEQDVENEPFVSEADDEPAAVTETYTAPAKKKVKGSHDSIHSSGFKDFLLKPELLRAIVDCGLEHPSEVQHECIQKAILGMDVMCRDKSGMGKTAHVVLSTLQQIEPVDGKVMVLVLCHSKELAVQISKEYKWFSKYMNTVKVAVLVSGLSIKKDREVLKKNCPHIVVGTPGRTRQLVKENYLNLKYIKHFVLCDCELILKWLDMRRDVIEIFRFTPHEKQCLMLSATLSKEIQRVCRKFMHYDEARQCLLLEKAEQDVENDPFAAGSSSASQAVTETSTAPAKKKVKGSHDSIHSSGFRDFLLKPELLRAIVDCGLEHPSEVQQKCIPKAILGMDVLCQAKSGMGKTAVFILATLQQIEPVDGQVLVLVICPARELAFHIGKKYERFSKYMNTVKVAVFIGGQSIKKDKELLKRNCPHIVVGTPGRTLLLVKEKFLDLKNVKHFVLEDCEMLEQLDVRRDVLEIFRFTPYEKQCMMFSATLSKEIRPVCRKFMHYDEARHFLLLETAEQDVENEPFVSEADEEPAAVTETYTTPAKKVKGSHVSIHSSGFRDFLLKPQLLHAIVDCGFEHPSKVQQECIPKAILGMDVLCQAKSGMGKTAVFILSTLQQIEPVDGQVIVLVLCHSRELVDQISKEYERFSKYMYKVKMAGFTGGLYIKKDRDVLKKNCPHIVVGTPGHTLLLAKEKYLDLKNIKHFVLEDCEIMLKSHDLRRVVLEIFRFMPCEKQCLMFSATLSKDIQRVCRKFMHYDEARHFLLLEKAEQDVENEPFAYEADEEPAAVTETSTAPAKKKVKGSHDSIHSSGFRDFLLKPELLRAIVDCGFEHPSEVEQS